MVNYMNLYDRCRKDDNKEKCGLQVGAQIGSIVTHVTKNSYYRDFTATKRYGVIK
jgi:hypothetical protein